MTRPLSRFRPRLLWVLALSAALTGCATMQSHDKLATDMQTAGRTGQPGGHGQDRRRKDGTALQHGTRRAAAHGPPLP
jgi:hypothetical protein